MTTTSKPKLHFEFIENDALEIIKKLQQRDYVTYLVGGCVRDLLLGILPKDFDIATMALPSEVKKCVPQSYIIGKRFRLVLAKRKNTLYEIATFRKNSPSGEEEPSTEEHENPDELAEISTGKIIGDNFFGSPEEDAFRRDFTINSLFYDPYDDQLHDFCNGLEDLNQRVIKMIGDPYVRLEEDPIRIMRGIRLAHKIEFDLEPKLREAMTKTAHTLKTAALPRKREEFIKWFRVKDPSLPFLEAFDLGVLEYISPTLNQHLKNKEQGNEFIKYLKTINEISFNKEETLFYYGLIVSAFVRSFFPNLLIKESIKIRDILENETLVQFMKFELGLFNYEQDLIARAFSLKNLLSKRVQLEKKGDKTIQSLFRNEAFPLALFLSKRDFYLSPEDWTFWYDSYHKAIPQLLASQPLRERKPKRKKKK